MKKIILFLLLISSAYATDNQVGLGLFNKESRYIGGEEKLYPFFKVDYKNFYIKGSEFGIAIPIEKALVTPFIKKDTTEGFKKGELSGENSNLDERKQPLLIGIKYGDSLKKMSYEFGINHDFTSEGNSIFLNLGYQQELFKFLYFLPNISFIYSDENYTDYYFGLSKEECSNILGNPYKDLKSSFRGSVQLGLAMFFSYKYGMYLSYNNEFMDKTQYNEKLIKSENNKSLTLMGFYRFWNESKYIKIWRMFVNMIVYDGKNLNFYKWIHEVFK